MAPSSMPPCSLTVRPITDAERQASIDSLKPLRYNAIGMSVIGIVTAIVVNFGTEIALLGVPLLFALIAGSNAATYKKNSRAISKGLADGVVSEIAGAPVRMKFRGSWQIGPVIFPSRGAVGKALQEGVVSRVALLPEAKMVLSVNGAPTKRGIPVVIDSAALSQCPAVPATSAQSVPAASPPAPPDADEVPPPPDDWDELFCSKCGQRNPGDARFCGRCGAIIKK